MKQYHDLCKHVLEHGVQKGDRTGTGTISVFGYQNRYDLSQGFPLVTTKKVPMRWVAEELFWFLRGEDNDTSLRAAGVDIWKEWAKEGGYLGPVYGVQWRSWPAGGSVKIDQLSSVIETIRRNPNSRRMLVSAWNPADLPDMALEPCHVLFQFYVTPAQPCSSCNGTGWGDAGGEDELCQRACNDCEGIEPKAKLSCQLYQRSADVFLGVPFNIASYALLTHIVAHMTGLEVGEFVHSFGDTHIYNNHIEQVRTQLTREPRPLPKLEILCEPKADPADYQWSDFRLVGYDPYPKIEGEVAV